MDAQERQGRFLIDICLNAIKAKRNQVLKKQCTRDIPCKKKAPGDTRSLRSLSYFQIPEIKR